MECPCCKEYDGITFKKLSDEYAHKMADNIVSPYAHKEALKCAKEKSSTRDNMFNEYYFMYYRVYYQGMFDTAVHHFNEHYIANSVERFQGAIEKTCDTFEARYSNYKVTGCGLYRGGIYDRFYQPMYPELEAAIDAYYISNQFLTPQ